MSFKKFVPKEDLNRYLDLLHKENKYSEYTEYLASKVGGSIKYSEYIAEQLDGSIKYSEYIAEQLNRQEKIIETKNIPDMALIKKYSEFIPTPVISTATKIKTVNDRFKIHDLYFDKCIIDFLNYENLDIFVKNINNIRVVGKGVDGSTVFEVLNESGVPMIIAMKNNTFYKYENKINDIYPEADLDGTMRNISEIDIKIGEREMELKELMDEEDIKIDNDTLELIGNYNDKIKNYYNEILENSDDLDLEKSNMETLMNTEILKI